jgi:probable F420-dependent oxidoreductase
MSETSPGRAPASALAIGALLPNVGAAASPQSIREFAVECEQRGLRSLWVGDHLLLPEHQLTPYPYLQSGRYVVPSDRDFLEAFTTLTWVAAQTDSIGLGVSVCIAPYRHKVEVAKIVGTIEFLAPGRLTLGVGTGWLADEFDALDVDFADRTRDTAELVRFLRRAAQAEGPFEVHNEGRPSHSMYLRPAPPADLPVWIGGNGPLARRRAARLGDAWHPVIADYTPEALAVDHAEVRALASELGRDPDTVGLTTFASVALADEPTDPALVQGLIRGPAGHIVETLLPYAEVGVSEVILSIGGSTRRRLATIDALADAGLPITATGG